ncbi:MAG TPA: hypothetical protein VJ729_01670 [Nitrososphaeraceae archaeon]|nr:hypothetical protein [Nitrososphaeraceae archaeon]
MQIFITSPIYQSRMNNEMLAIVAIAFAIVLGAGTAIGMVEVQQAHAIVPIGITHMSQAAFAHIPNKICNNCN